MIQAYQKDTVLRRLVEISSLGSYESIPRTMIIEGFSDDALSMFLQDFAGREFIEFIPTSSNFTYKVFLSAHDFLRRGGFMGEELLFQDKIEKLYSELEKLQKENSEILPSKTKIKITETIQTVAAIIEMYKAIST